MILRARRAAPVAILAVDLLLTSSAANKIGRQLSFAERRHGAEKNKQLL